MPNMRKLQTVINNYSFSIPHIGCLLYQKWLTSANCHIKNYCPSEVTRPTVIPGVHPTFSSMGSRGSFPGLKWHGHEADHSPPTNVKLRRHESIPPFPMSPYGMHSDNFFTFLFYY
jgi:hypothetical protein